MFLGLACAFFDYGNTDIEKHFLFYKRLIPLLRFGRERDTVDLPKGVLTHHSLRNLGRQPLGLNHGGEHKLPPIDAVSSSTAQEKQRTLIDKIIEKVQVKNFPRPSMVDHDVTIIAWC